MCPGLISSKKQYNSAQGYKGASTSDFFSSSLPFLLFFLLVLLFSFLAPLCLFV